MSLQGADGLRRRLHALEGVFGVVYPRWQDETVAAMRPMIPVRTGASRRSVQKGRVDDNSAGIVGSGTLNFIDAGSKAHDITAKDGVLKFTKGQTFFRKKVRKPRIAPRPFKAEAARKGLERADPLGVVVKLWDGAD